MITFIVRLDSPIRTKLLLLNIIERTHYFKFSYTNMLSLLDFDLMNQERHLENDISFQ